MKYNVKIRDSQVVSGLSFASRVLAVYQRSVVTELCDRVITAMLIARLLGDGYHFVPAQIQRLYFCQLQAQLAGNYFLVLACQSCM